MNIVKVSDLNQIVSFIQTSSNEFASYIYKLSIPQEDVELLLTSTLKFPGVFCLLEDNEIKSLLTAIKYDDNKFKVVGPYVGENFNFKLEHFDDLFTALRKSLPNETIFNFSYDECSQDSKTLMKHLGANYNFTDYYLNAYSTLNKSGSEQNIIEYQPVFQRPFSRLHEQTFKHNVLTPRQIVESLDNNNRLFLFVSEGLLKGYLYLQVSPTQSIGEIRYFSSHSDYRLKGIAFDLLSFAINFAFNHYSLNKVYFKIRSKNATLVERFNELGFEIETEFKKYKFEALHARL
ncbi:GNAT family N-acetyltransferase [Staphylococcus devriesei]|uniref:GNAT family N-acetyltransferase n=1 Tax=Staphylococcus devriesei TaxID=586733 RepID=A0A2K4DKH7_9STAP|nr:GNAT family N-acetyltransferase [Staphylococcus devriesei]MCE5097878.1 GNAT family N-acetyltransferase [Staphylococcus devriesei]PNZ87342.1 N-acetyltransferase [Staphylococcus devriesei]PTE74683.1 GNAT family N-acetyltransferase [Staphylococcus devriesei]PTF14046.1 GNAT family N-acetyltransferase [Staphylococcus devriesei]RIL75451.1 GNAT family N-acetyltransferase [Staphylococcus devriesei]